MVDRHAVGSKNPFEMSANTFERSTGPLVSSVRVEADSQRLPLFESMRQHQKFGFSVGRGPDCRLG